MAHLRNSNWLHPQIEGAARRRFGTHLSATVATTFAVLAIGAGLVGSSMILAASGAAVRSSDLSPHGAFVPGTPDTSLASPRLRMTWAIEPLQPTALSPDTEMVLLRQNQLETLMWWAWSVLTRPATIQAAGGR
jgi:hypothetical protein